MHLQKRGGKGMRLTRWNGKKYVLPQGRTWRMIAERLAAYENTGLEPEEIDALKHRLNIVDIKKGYDQAGNLFRIETVKQYGRYEIKVNDEFWSTAETWDQVQTEIGGIVETFNLTSAW